MNENRINWIDYAKSFAILGIIIIHTHCNFTLVSIINAFVLPLFFIISGYLFTYDRNPKFLPFAKKRFKQLMIPYLAISALAYIVWWFFLKNYGETIDNVEWYEPIVGTILGYPSKMPHNTPLWALFTFFVVEIIYYPFGKNKKLSWLIPTICILTSFILYIFYPNILTSLPLSFGTVVISIFYYGLGHLWSSNKQLNKYILSPFTLPLFIILFIFLFSENSATNYYICDYSNMPLFVAGSISGALIIINLSYQLSKIGTPKIIKYISNSTLIVCGIHLLVLAGYKAILYFGFHKPVTLLTHGLMTGVFTSVIVLFTCLPFGIFYSKYLRAK